MTALPIGFTEVQQNVRLNAAPVTLLQTPDGRLLVTTDDNKDLGAVRIIKNGEVLPTPALQLQVHSEGEFGMIGMVLDPQFETNGYIYILYTTLQNGLHNRLSRFTFTGDVIAPNSEFVLMNFDTLGTGTVHNGGGMVFGNDGKIYVGIGENANALNAQTLNNRLGKIIRINPDGTIPTDNPFYNTATGDNRVIYALGVRNPFTMDVDRVTGRIFFNDVGPARGEEINEVQAGANYGWPINAGPNNNPLYKDPVYSYGHGGGACAITGGRFSRSANTALPDEYDNKYFFTDYCAAWMNMLDLDTGVVTPFATGLSGRVVSPFIDASGAIYYLSREARAVFKIDYQGNAALSIIQNPQNKTVVIGESATFSVSVSGSQPITYAWQKKTGNGSYANISNATSPTLLIVATTAADNESMYRVMITNALGSVTSQAATLTVSAANRPVPVITSPLLTQTYAGGDLITYAGFATDEDEVGNLPASGLTWEVALHHDSHDHPFIAPITGMNGGTFTIPNVGETSDNVWYRIKLKATDAAGLTAETFRDIFPKKASFTLASNIPGIELTLDGTPVVSPVTTLGVVGILRSIGAASTQIVGGQGYRFVRWSNGGLATHTISTPSIATTYTVIFEPAEVTGPDDAVTTFTFDQGSGVSAGDTATTGVADTAVLTNGAAWVTDGKVNGAVRFDGVNDYLAVPDSRDFNDRVVARTTIAFWFRADDLGRTGKQLLFKQSGSNRGFNAYLDGGKLYVGAWSDDRNWAGTFLSSEAIQGGTWHHVALVLDAEGNLAPNRMVGYLDGVQFGIGPAAEIKRHLGNISLGALDQSTRFHTGASTGPDSVSPFLGLIDEFRLYHRPLSAGEVQVLAGAPTPPPPPPPSQLIQLSIDDVSQLETNAGETHFEFTITADAVSTSDITVQVNTANVGSAVAGSDYTAVVNQVAIIRAGTLSTTVEIHVNGDTVAEANETFEVRLSEPLIGGVSDPARVAIRDATGVATILNDDIVATPPIDAGLVTRFTFDETSAPFRDSAPQGVADLATLVNGATRVTDGALAGAIRFDGVNDYLLIADSTDINNRSVTKTTVAFWFNADNVDRSGKQLLYKQSGNDRGLNVYLDGGQLYVGAFSDKRNWTGTFLSTAGGAIHSGHWYHVALVLDADVDLAPNRMVGYLDGVQFGIGPAAEIKTHLGNISMGALDQGTRFHTGISGGPDSVSAFAGYVDDLRIYNRPLTRLDVVGLVASAGPIGSIPHVSGSAGEATTSLSFTAFAPKVQSKHNTKSPADVNDDGLVTPYDALLVINGISKTRSASGESLSAITPAKFPDVTGDGLVTPLDALRVISTISSRNRQAPTPTSSASLTHNSIEVKTTFSNDDEPVHGGEFSMPENSVIDAMTTPYETEDEGEDDENYLLLAKDIAAVWN